MTVSSRLATRPRGARNLARPRSKSRSSAIRHLAELYRRVVPLMPTRLPGSPIAIVQRRPGRRSLILAAARPARRPSASRSARPGSTPGWLNAMLDVTAVASRSPAGAEGHGAMAESCHVTATRRARSAIFGCSGSLGSKGQRQAHVKVGCHGAGFCLAAASTRNGATPARRGRQEPDRPLRRRGCGR